MTREPELTHRQTQVVACVKAHMPDKQIAARLGISVDTVRYHIEAAAARAPGRGSPRLRVALFFVNVEPAG